MVKDKKINIDFAQLQQKITSQFQGLNPNDPSTWPAVPRYSLCLLATIAVVVVLWFVWLQNSAEDLKKAETQQTTLQNDYKQKLVQAINLETLKKQREQVQQNVTQLEKQLPSKADIDAFLSDVNQAALGRSLQFESTRPNAVVVKDYYAELPILIKITGRYHDIGAFASDVANLSRIVTLSNLVITPNKDNSLTLETTARTFRYLDPDEVKSQQSTKKPSPGAPK
jgi:type IV pilus assembly protein PilO